MVCLCVKEKVKEKERQSERETEKDREFFVCVECLPFFYTFFVWAN